MKSLFVVANLALFLARGCYDSIDLADTDPDGGTDVTPDHDAGPSGEEICATDKVDLLFVVDNSNSMTEEQAALSEAFPILARALTTGDSDGDGRVDVRPIPDLHVGVVTTDMGNGGYMVPTCNSTYGDDGVLITRPGTGLTGCASSYPPFLSFVQGTGGDVESFSHDFACVATAGTGGCGFEQQLDAMLKAVTPSTSPILFTNDTSGHGDRENAAFLRPDSTLVVVVITDEDDCSTSDPALFATGAGGRYTGDLNLRCFKYPAVPHPISRYVDGLRTLAQSRRAPVLFAALAGVPVDLVADADAVDMDALLDDPRMIEREETATMGGIEMSTGRLVPSCTTSHGVAYPPRRIVEVAKELGQSGLVQSICQDDYGAAARAIARRVGHLAPACR